MNLKSQAFGDPINQTRLVQGISYRAHILVQVGRRGIKLIINRSNALIKNFNKWILEVPVSTWFRHAPKCTISYSKVGGRMLWRRTESISRNTFLCRRHPWYKVPLIAIIHYKMLFLNHTDTGQLTVYFDLYHQVTRRTLIVISTLNITKMTTSFCTSPIWFWMG